MFELEWGKVETYRSRREVEDSSLGKDPVVDFAEVAASDAEEGLVADAVDVVAAAAAVADLGRVVRGRGYPGREGWP